MAEYLDLAAWPRRDAFNFFRGFDKPYFNACVRLDVAQLKAALAARGRGGLALAYHFIALCLANRLSPFRLRLEGQRVRVRTQHHGAARGRPFACPADYQDGFSRLAAHSAARAQRGRPAPFEPRLDDTAVIHFTLPAVLRELLACRNWARGLVPLFGRPSTHANWMPCRWKCTTP
jgi:chloramphenicol O-acetyltransferase type A